MRMGSLLGLAAASMLMGVLSITGLDFGVTLRPGGEPRLGQGRVSSPGKKRRIGGRRQKAYGERESGRYVGWPEGPMNNREARTHYPRRHHVLENGAGELIEMSGDAAEFAKIGGQGIYDGWHEFNAQSS